MVMTGDIQASFGRRGSAPAGYGEVAGASEGGSAVWRTLKAAWIGYLAGGFGPAARHTIGGQPTTDLPQPLSTVPAAPRDTAGNLSRDAGSNLAPPAGGDSVIRKGYARRLSGQDMLAVEQLAEGVNTTTDAKAAAETAGILNKTRAYAGTGRGQRHNDRPLSVYRRDWPRLAHTDYHLVVARHSEDLFWLEGVPEAWRITVYNTGPSNLPNKPDRRYEIVPVQNTKHGKEGLIFATHIARNWGEGLADYTVFSQANPFDHNEHFLDLLWHPALLLPVQTMSLKFSDIVPPVSVLRIHSPDPWYRSERFSLFTMDSIYFKDCCVHTVAAVYREHFNLSQDVNLASHMFESIGLPEWVHPSQQVGSFPYGGMFGASRSAIAQHPQRVYARMVERLDEHVMVGYIIERLWLMLLGGADYIDRDLDPIVPLDSGSNHTLEEIA